MTLLVRYESMIDRQLNKAMTQLQKLQANPQQAFPPYQGGTKGGCKESEQNQQPTQNPPAPKEPICDPSDPSSSTISCSPAQLSRPQGAPPDLHQESEEQKLMKHINQLCLRMLNDPPALMRFLSNPPPYTSGLVEDDEDDQTNPTSSTDPLFNCSPPLRRRRPPLHGPKTIPSNMEET
ncbi:MAG: hypothetical protein ACYTF1_26115, partial [Planctomycetota bacterium]|jgi:hypothetical protein